MSHHVDDVSAKVAHKPHSNEYHRCVNNLVVRFVRRVGWATTACAGARANFVRFVLARGRTARELGDSKGGHSSLGHLFELGNGAKLGFKLDGDHLSVHG